MADLATNTNHASQLTSYTNRHYNKHKSLSHPKLNDNNELKDILLAHFDHDYLPEDWGSEDLYTSKDAQILKLQPKNANNPYKKRMSGNCRWKCPEIKMSEKLQYSGHFQDTGPGPFLGHFPKIHNISASGILQSPNIFRTFSMTIFGPPFFTPTQPPQDDQQIVTKS